MKIQSLNEQLKNKIYKKVINNGLDKCWDWNHRLNDYGYGMIKFNRKNMLAHRASYMIYKGEIPQGLLVLHTCDNRPCTNPNHLYLGTHKDNMRDTINRSRLNSKPNKGENHVRSKLKNNDVIKINNMIKNNEIIKLIAKKFNVCKQTIYDIKYKNTWKHIKD